ncbi:TPA: hypothetical protein I8273_004611 [Aeromonas hydrophila]|nr:hypothetical protein [Aeromonas hydrophila]HAT2639073.1 hypothetical protein [Aeromonas hydrophila]HAT3424237.1 hypothetical protein [Aeromonas hydrophila]HAT3534235.1 hypothetical protein [Aeromonas hydrophila]
MNIEDMISQVQPHLMPGYQLAISASAHGAIQVELTRDTELVWRSWTFEPDFPFNFHRELCRVCVKPDSLDTVFDLNQTL